MGMPARRVLHIVHSMDMGGIETFIMNVYRRIDRETLQFDFIVNIDKQAVYDEEIKRLGGNIYYIPPRGKGIIKHRKALNIFFNERGRNYVAIHQHSSSLTSILPLIYAKKYRIKTRIIHSHATFESFNILHRSLHTINKSRISHYANLLFACSDMAANWFYSNKSNVKIINNGIDTSSFKYNIDIRNNIRTTYAVYDKLVFGHIGSFIKTKNQKYVIDVFKAFLEINPDTVLWFIGDGQMLDEITRYANNLNIVDKIRFWGKRKDTNELVQAMDIFVFPSFFEGLPLALIETQTAGLKVFASKNISTLASLTSNIKFLDINSKPTVWAKAINRVLPYVRKDCSQEIIKKGFDISTTADYLSKLYLENEK